MLAFFDHIQIFKKIIFVHVLIAVGGDASFLGCVYLVRFTIHNKHLNNKFVVYWSVLGVCTDGSSPDDLFRLGVDVQGLNVLHIVIAHF